MGLWLLARGMEHTNMWAEPNRACIWIKQRFCYNEMQASFCYNRASIEEKGVGAMHFRFQECFQEKTPMKRYFFEELKAEGGFSI